MDTSPALRGRIASVPLTLWLTGRPCSGKSTLALKLKERMPLSGIRTVHLDGDRVRGRLNADLGFSEHDRRENLRRIAHVAQLFNENGSSVIASFVSPTEALRSLVSGIVRNFVLCYVRCSLHECERRDVKGMYRKARAGLIEEFTGITSAFEEPARPDIVVDTERESLEACVDDILRGLGLLSEPPQVVELKRPVAVS